MEIRQLVTEKGRDDIANYLKETFQPNENQNEPQVLEKVGEEMDIAFVTPNEVTEEIKTNINPKRPRDMIS
jgi:hypothetical protein